MRYIIVLTLAVAMLPLGCEKPKPVEPAPVVQPRTEFVPMDAAPSKVTTGPSAPGPIGPGPITPKPGPVVTSSGKGTYTIQADDKGGYFAISRKLFGTDTRWKEIQALNPGVDPTTLKPGQVIKVPEK